MGDVTLTTSERGNRIPTSDARTGTGSSGTENHSGVGRTCGRGDVGADGKVSTGDGRTR